MSGASWVALLGVLVLGFALGFGAAGWRLLRVRRELDVARTELKSQAAIEAERERALERAGEQLGTQLSQRAYEQFKNQSETFLKLARESLSAHHERAKGDLSAREQAIENMLRPIREMMQRTEAQLHELEKARRETHGSIKTQLEAMAESHKMLSAETRNLVNALRRPEVRGQWGELTLHRLVELAGMVEHCDFVKQAHTATPSGAVRPDMIIRLPEGRELVVDVKTPLDAYLEATEAPTDADRNAALTRHASILAGRVRELAGKAYWSQFEQTPEFVILFIPGDQFLSAALTERPELLDEALRQNIILATPTSLVALLKAVAYGWRQVALAENAAEIRELAVQLHDRLGTFASHLAAVGKSLGDSVDAYNRSVGSLERMVLPNARKFAELGVKPRKDLDALKPIEKTTRAVQHGAAEDEPAAGPLPAAEDGAATAGDDADSGGPGARDAGDDPTPSQAGGSQ